MPILTLAGGARLAYGDSGAGRPLVLVHGSPAEGRAWGRVARHLAIGFRVLTPDMPGYGASDALPAAAPPATAAMAAAVGALIAAMGEPVWVAGHSYGGNVALHAALAQRARIKGLALFEPVFFRGLELAGERAALDSARLHFEDYVRRVEGGESAAVSRMVDFWFGAGAFDRLPAPARGFLEKTAPKNAADVKSSFRERIGAAELAAFDRPALIAYGASSPPVVGVIATTLARLLPRAEALSVAGGTHAMLDTHPDAVAALINRLAVR